VKEGDLGFSCGGLWHEYFYVKRPLLDDIRKRAEKFDEVWRAATIEGNTIAITMIGHETPPVTPAEAEDTGSDYG
jgi:hypothetical protein